VLRELPCPFPRWGTWKFEGRGVTGFLLPRLFSCPVENRSKEVVHKPCLLESSGEVFVFGGFFSAKFRIYPRPTVRIPGDKPRQAVVFFIFLSTLLMEANVEIYTNHK
jgi:hypothetical protein